MTKLEEMQNKLVNLISDMQKKIDSDDLDGAEQIRDQIKALKTKIDQQIFVDELEAEDFKATAKTIPQNKQTKTSANFVRACIKKFSNQHISEDEREILVQNSLVLPNTTNPNGANGEAYILPEDIRTIITRQIRQYRSFRDVLGYYKTTALSGAFPVENLDSITGLIDFEDGTDGNDTYNPTFAKVPFKLKEKAAFIKLSNTLLALTDNDLIAYIAEVFAKRAVITENTMAVAVLKTDKTVKTLATWKALKSSLNKDLDPAALHSTVIVTNQDGFDFLDSQLDGNQRPVLQTDVTQPTVKRFAGYQVIVFSNALLPTVTRSSHTYAPFFYGDMKDGAKFVDLDVIAFKTSDAAGFYSNTTVARLIEFVDVIQCDNSDKCYICGEVQTDAS